MALTLVAGWFTATVVWAQPPATEEWVPRYEVTGVNGHLSFLSRWDPAIGLRFKFAQPGEVRAVFLDISRVESAVRLVPEKEFSAAIGKGAQFNPDALPTHTLDSARMVLKFSRQIWTLYMQDRPVAVIPAPFSSTTGVYQVSENMPPGDQRLARFQKTDDFVFEDSFLAPTSTVTQLEGWSSLSGNWSLYTVVDSSLEREANRLGGKDGKKIPQADYSPNFSSLLGRGTNAMIAAGYDFYDSYLFEAAVLVVPGEMGLIFHHSEGGGYHAFTVRMREDSHTTLMSIWKAASQNSLERETLAAVTTQLTPEQWIKLRVKTYQNRVQCFMDNIKVLDVAAELPAGGRFGLLCRTARGTRFDDVRARSNRDLDFRGISEIRRHTLVEQGDFFPRRRFFHLFPPKDTGDALEVAKARSAQWLVVGSIEDAGHVFSADFETPAAGTGVGLVIQYRGEDAPFLRFTSRVVGGEELLALESVTNGAPVVLDEIRLAVAPGKPGETRSLRLMADTTNGREARLYRDGDLVLIHSLDADPRGASGVLVDAGASARITRLAYYFERENLYRNQFEKNRNYVTDPFMRHWSSPEGQWLEERDKSTWYKGDFFGRFLLCLPFIPKSEIHLGVGEDSTNGVLVVAARDGQLVLETPDGQGGRQKVAQASSSAMGIEPSVPVPEKDSLTERKWFTVHHEGYWVWVTSGVHVLLKHRLSEPFRGRRVRITGFSTEQLKFSYVEQYNIKDHLFTESLHEWIQNGGEWSVVNRFQCQPRWSHMNGESRDGLAALWSKFSFRGDFCVEMYAGFRHGWYDRAGDLNLTVMSSATTPSQGYTITCTGWDPDRSQLYTRLYRNGQVAVETDKYLIPRNREDKKRKGYEPLVQAGRDLHGAWYYIKFRRVGQRLEYYFDNDLVFAHTDGQPLDAGSLGVWTFMNSMMVARVKMAAEHIEPRPMIFAAATVEAVAAFDASPGEAPFRAHADVQKNGRSLELNTPAWWKADDDVGRATVRWDEPPGEGPCFVTTTALGSGTMLTRCRLPPRRCKDLAGWRFFVKRTAKAQFNFHYSIGTLTASNTVIPQARLYHRLSGDDFSQGLFVMSGGTDVPGVPATGADWCRQGEWVPVDVWLADVSPPDPGDGENLYVQVEGFGNLQPSRVMEGLTGNAPGDAYAVRGFSEILYAAPQLSFATNLPAPRAVAILDPASGRTLGVCTNATDLQARIDRVEGAGVMRLRLDITRERGVARQDLGWIRLPPEPDMTVEWDTERPSAFALISKADYPDRRFSRADVLVGGRRVRMDEVSMTRRVGAVPRDAEFQAVVTSTVPVTVTADGKSRAFRLAWKDRPVADRPVLMRLTGLTGFFENFESREMPKSLLMDARRMKLRLFDSEQGACLEVGNGGKSERLVSTFATPVNLAHCPVMQFRYQASGMVNVSLLLRHAYGVHVNESYPAAKRVRGTQTLVLDGKWHSWLGLVSDAVEEPALEKGILDCWNASLGSRARVDQTGLYSEWAIDDVAFGPAVSSGDQLSMVPEYFDFAGVDKVRVAVRAGQEAYDALTPEDRDALVWLESRNAQKITPDILGLTNGICHLFFMARSKAGRDSAVTDLPFLFDDQPMELTASMQASEEPLHNGSVLRVTLDTLGGAPADVGGMELMWNTEKVPWEGLGSKYKRLPGRETLVLNWPYIFRERLNKMDESETARIVLSNMRDGAGNPAPDVSVPIALNLKDDRTPPTLLSTEYPTNILWCTAWESEAKSSVTLSSNGALSLRRKAGKESYLRMTQRGKGDLWINLVQAQWVIAKYPYLAFRIRRPEMRTGDASTIGLEVEFGKGKGRCSISMTEPAGTNQISLPQSIAWQSNVWHGVTLDLPKVLASKLTAKEMEDTPIETIRLRQQKGEADAVLDLQSIFVFAPWQPEDRVKVHAFDANGIEGITWSYEDTTESTTVAPATLMAESQGNRWMMMRALDRAGNPSAPIRLPVADLRD